MLRTNRLSGGCLAIAFAMSMAGTAHAQTGSMVLNPAVTSALIAAPYFTDPSGVFTAILLTNTSNSDTVLHIQVINGDAGEDWGEQNFFCGMTPNETTLILMTANGASGATIEIECSDEGRNTNAGDIINGQVGTVEDLNVDGARGIVVVTQVDVATENLTQYTNRFIADWQVIDLAAATAFGAEAAGFQVGNPATCTGPPTGNAGGGCPTDFAYEFGTELSSFPTIFGADFIAPTGAPNADPVPPGIGSVDVEFIFITLDGREGVPPAQKLDGFYYNDDEDKNSYNDIEYECMEVVRLLEIDRNMASTELCDGNAPLGCVGHIVFNQDTVSVGTSQHDLPFGADGFGGAASPTVRLSATIGWIVHRYANAGNTVILPGIGPITGNGATARFLTGSANNLVGLGGDTIALDLR